MKYIDLFAGCGGLSLGLERAGFELVLAVEKSEMAAQTFYHNFIKKLEDDNEWKEYRELPLDKQFEKKVLSKELGELLADKKLIKKLKAQKIDLVVGGPPCQGFSLAGRRNPNDERNKLPWQYLEFVEEINPRAVVIENVVGMNRGFKQHGKDAPFEQLQEALRNIGLGYEVQAVHVNAMHYGVPEHRPRLMILGLRKDIAKAKGIKSTNLLWHSSFMDEVVNLPDLAPAPSILKNEVRTLKDAIGDLANGSFAKTSFSKEMSNAKLWKLKPLKKDVVLNHNNRNHQEKAISRFRLYQYLSEQGLDSKVLNVPANNSEELAVSILKELLTNVQIPAKSPDGKTLAKTRKELVDLIFELKTKKHSQRALLWNKPSPTVVTLPDDYVHPAQPRIFTVRELARIQSFPDAFEFKSKETTGSERRRFEVPQYSQVGNAVAPLLAYAVGKKFLKILE